MSPMKTAFASLAILAFAGAAYAQTDTMSKGSMSSSENMSSGSMHMSKSQMATMNKCKAMSHDAMMKSHSCMKMMKAHPDMMKGSMSSDSMGH